MNKKYLDSKKGSLEELSTKIATEQPTIDRTFNPNVNLKVERKYFDTKPGSLADAAAKVVSEGLDPVNKVAVKKDFADRKDKDIDNDGDTDSTDKYLHKRRQAISKSMSENKRRSTQLIGPSKEHIKKLGLVRKGNVVYDKSGKYYGYVDKIYYQGKDTPFLHKVTGIEGKPFQTSAPVRKDQRPPGVKYQPSYDGMTGKKFAGEELGKEDEPKIKKIIGKLKKASGAHAGQAKDLEKAMKEEKDCPPGYYYCKMSGTCKPNSMREEKDFKPHMMYDPKTGKGYKANKYADHVRMDKMGYTHEKPKSESVMPDDKGEKINQMKHKLAKRGEKEIVKLKEVDNAYAVGMSQAMKSTGDKPPLKKSTITKAHDIAKGIMKKEGFASDAQRRAAFASGYKEKGKDKKENKTFSELRKQTGEKGKTLTGSQPSVIETEPKTERI